MVAKADQLYEQKKFEEALQWYLKEAETGNKLGQYFAGYAYFKGEGNGTNEDITEAEVWAQKGHDNGSYEATAILGFIKCSKLDEDNLQKGKSYLFDIARNNVDFAKTFLAVFLHAGILSVTKEESEEILMYGNEMAELNIEVLSILSELEKMIDCEK